MKPVLLLTLCVAAFALTACAPHCLSPERVDLAPLGIDEQARTAFLGYEIDPKHTLSLVPPITVGFIEVWRHDKAYPPDNYTTGSHLDRDLDFIAFQAASDPQSVWVPADSDGLRDLNFIAQAVKLQLPNQSPTYMDATAHRIFRSGHVFIEPLDIYTHAKQQGVHLLVAYSIVSHATSSDQLPLVSAFTLGLFPTYVGEANATIELAFLSTDTRKPVALHSHEVHTTRFSNFWGSADLQCNTFNQARRKVFEHALAAFRQDWPDLLHTLTSPNELRAHLPAAASQSSPAQ
ncbi:MAG: hypothetical protein AAF797_15540 [Planctomycetota bacterium]